MKTLLLLLPLLATGIFSSSGSRPITGVIKDAAPPADTNLAMFARGIYPGDDTTFNHLKASGFTTIMLSSFYIRSNGDVYSGDDHKNPIIHNGKYVGDRSWLKRVASLKKGKTSVTRIEILLEGRWYNQPPNTFDFIMDWADGTRTFPGIVTGTGTNSTLYKICKVLKEKIGADAICIDDESVYHSPSIILLGGVAAKLNMHMTLCPFKLNPYWKEIMAGSQKGLIDAIYLQCYDGGTRNVPADWIKALGDTIPLYPIFLCRGAFSTCATNHNSKTPDEIKAEMIRFRKGYPGMKGGAIWQMADVKQYVSRNCAVQDPSSGTASSVTEYLSQLKSSLKEGLDQ